MSKKIFTSLGLMSGTSMDGVDVSLIQSDGKEKFDVILNKYYEFDQNLYKKLIELRNKISSENDLSRNQGFIDEIERNFTLFNCEIVNDLIVKKKLQIDLIGFHGQTILHIPEMKISKQLGDGNLLSNLTKTKVINQFRQNDLENGGQGAPLTPIFHFLISKTLNKKFKLDYPMDIINIGGITNVTQIENTNNENKTLYAYDIGPGNCLIDEWVRKNTNQKFDLNGNIAKKGKVDELVFNQAIENFSINDLNKSLDIKDFDISFIRGLSLEDGCATITKYTAFLISEGIKKIDRKNKLNTKNLYVCGGGRNNNTLINNINELLNRKNVSLKNIDDYQFDGDYIESQAFAYLAIRSYLGLPISFPQTTRVLNSLIGGVLIKNF